MDKFFGKIIDAHCHFSHKEIPSRLGADGKPHNDGKFINESLDFLLAEHARMGVKKVAMSTFCSMHNVEEIRQENDYLEKVTLGNESVLQWVVVDPRDDYTFLQAERMLKKPRVLGVKIHSPMHKYDIHEYSDKIFSWANEREITVLMHPDDILYCAKKAEEYPKMNLIIAHLATYEHFEALKNAKCGNLYTDTSGIGSYKNNIIEYTVGKIGSEKILFGTDTYSCAFQLGRIYFSGISDQDKENILYKNAQKLFQDRL